MKRKNMYPYYMLFIAAAFFFVLQFPANAFSDSVNTATSVTVGSVIAGHNTCEQCHGRFPDSERLRGRNSGRAGSVRIQDGERGRPARIPARKVDQLCLGCHGPAGISNLKADIHGNQNFVARRTIGCLTCHDPHDNNPNYLDGRNIKLIGKVKRNKRSNYAWIRTPGNGRQNVVFESRGTDAGEPSLHSFADGDEDNNGIFDGICESCHTRTKYHRNNPSGETGHYTGSTCTNCHTHENQFLAVTRGPAGPKDISGRVVDTSGSAWSYITLFLDLNGNGIYDEGEPTAVTDENGKFIFRGMAGKGYDVLVMDGFIPDGYDVTVTVINGRIIITTTARPATLNGHVWSDTNQSGAYDTGDEGIGGIILFIDSNGNKVHDPDEPAATTDSLGFYSFDDLAHGTYEVFIDTTSVHAGYELVTGSNPLHVLLAPGQVQTADFGYRTLFQVTPAMAGRRINYLTRLTWTSDGGYYVTDNKAGSVFIYDNTGTITRQLKGLDKPLGITTDSKGRIYVGNNGRDNVEIYSAGGILQQTLGNGEIKMPNDLALDRDQRLYVVDSRNQQVRVFNPDGSDALTIGSPGDGLFSFPIALTIHYRMENGVEMGELYVADKASSYIHVFDLQGNFSRSLGGPVVKEGWFNPTWVWVGLFAGIQSLAFDQNGMLHALDSFMDNVQILDPVTGAYQGYYDAFINDRGAQIQLDIDINPGGEVIMTNTTTRGVELIHTVQ